MVEDLIQGVCTWCTRKTRPTVYGEKIQVVTRKLDEAFLDWMYTVVFLPLSQHISEVRQSKQLLR